jgi:GNAT superfamily N-acetyltransferase
MVDEEAGQYPPFVCAAEIVTAARGLRAVRTPPDQLADLHAIIAACGHDLKERLGLTHWDPPYPLRLLRRDAAERAVYAVKDSEFLIGTFTVGRTPLNPYPPHAWSEPEAPALYLNRLAVWPGLQGHGIGRSCLTLVEQIARQLGCEAMRLDAYAGHSALLAFYEHAGYVRRLLVEEHGFVCFEKRLTE